MHGSAEDEKTTVHGGGFYRIFGRVVFTVSAHNVRTVILLDAIKVFLGYLEHEDEDTQHRSPPGI